MTQRHFCSPKGRFSRSLQGSDGFSLVEVLVSLVILSIGLLGLAALQTRSLGSTHNAALGSQATLLAGDISDRMRANRDQALAGRYDIGLGQAADAKGATGVTLQDLQQWKAALALLPGPGRGAVQVVGSTATVTIEWDDSKGAEPAVQMLVQTRL